MKFYYDIIQPEHPNSDLEGLLSMFQHDQTHFSKMVANLLPIMNMLTSGELGPLLSPDSSDLSDERQITDSAKSSTTLKLLIWGSTPDRQHGW